MMIKKIKILSVQIAELFGWLNTEPKYLIDLYLNYNTNSKGKNKLSFLWFFLLGSLIVITLSRIYMVNTSPMPPAEAPSYKPKIVLLLVINKNQNNGLLISYTNSEFVMNKNNKKPNFIKPNNNWTTQKITQKEIKDELLSIKGCFPLEDDKELKIKEKFIILSLNDIGKCNVINSFQNLKNAYDRAIFYAKNNSKQFESIYIIYSNQ